MGPSLWTQSSISCFYQVSYQGTLTSSHSSNPTAAFTTSDIPCHSFPITGDTHAVCGPLICSTVSMVLAQLPSAVSHVSRQTQDSWKCQVAGGLLFPLLVCLSHPLSCSGSEQLSTTAPSACVPCGSRSPSPLVSDTPISVSVPLFSSSMESTGAPTFSRMTHIRQSLLRLLCMVLCLLCTLGSLSYVSSAWSCACFGQGEWLRSVQLVDSGLLNCPAGVHASSCWQLSLEWEVLGVSLPSAPSLSHRFWDNRISIINPPRCVRWGVRIIHSSHTPRS